MRAEAARIARHAVREGSPYGLVGCESADGETLVLVPYYPMFDMAINQVQLGIRANYARLRAGGQRMMIMLGGSIYEPEVGPVVGQRPMAALITTSPDEVTSIWFAELGRNDEGEVWMEEWEPFANPDPAFFGPAIAVLEMTAVNFPMESNVAEAAESLQVEAMEVRYE
jgi:hypothetical protein